jgi:hypothetical protein
MSSAGRLLAVVIAALAALFRQSCDPTRRRVRLSGTHHRKPGALPRTRWRIRSYAATSAATVEFDSGFGAPLATSRCKVTRKAPEGAVDGQIVAVSSSQAILRGPRVNLTVLAAKPQTDPRPARLYRPTDRWRGHLALNVVAGPRRRRVRGPRPACGPVLVAGLFLGPGGPLAHPPAGATQRHVHVLGALACQATTHSLFTQLLFGHVGSSLDRNERAKPPERCPAVTRPA